jgi:hypothetical protein
MLPAETIAQFDRFLADRGLRLDAVIVGGTALNLLGVVLRPTKDCDVLWPALPSQIASAGREFARERRRQGEFLDDHWLNDGPSALSGDLPPGGRDRLQPAWVGVAIELRTLGRIDLLRSKLFALCDRALDLPDCIALAPDRGELETILPWLEQRDGNPDWPTHVRAVLADLARRLGHGV